MFVRPTIFRRDKALLNTPSICQARLLGQGFRFYC
jgi:hypothetical protein